MNNLVKFNPARLSSIPYWCYSAALVTVGGKPCSLVGGDIVPVDTCDLIPGHPIEDRATSFISTVDAPVIGPWLFLLSIQRKSEKLLTLA